MVLVDESPTVLAVLPLNTDAGGLMLTLNLDNKEHESNILLLDDISTITEYIIEILVVLIYLREQLARLRLVQELAALARKTREKK